jgi:hypothetical protein
VLDWETDMRPFLTDEERERIRQAKRELFEVCEKPQPEFNDDPSDFFLIYDFGVSAQGAIQAGWIEPCEWGDIMTKYKFPFDKSEEDVVQ